MARARIEAGVVDVFVIRTEAGRRRTEAGSRKTEARGRPGASNWRVLALRRTEHTRSTGSWETVHGRIEARESPPEAAIRELREETGLTPARLYSITVNPFYLQQSNTVQLAVVFAAFVEGSVVKLGPEHDEYEWLTVAGAAKRFTWPREIEALTHIRRLLSSGNAGAVEDVLRVR
jgi:dihydroneopterin triphosphate diphosphatase